ncbi:MAG: fibronectin type III domain-containing protein [Lachnospiraceae bacterium]|nr:fibronectin type III domain-containing protein [Lachnospiraceae bacterium]
MKIKSLGRSAIAVMGLAGLLSLGFVKPAEAAPAKPAGLVQTASTETGIKVQWGAVAGATGYSVSIYSLDGKTKVMDAKSVTSPEFTINDTEQKILTHGTAYQVAVKAIDASGESELATAPIATAPKAMTSFEQTAASATTATITWSASPSPGISGYLIKMGADAASAKDITTVDKSKTTVKLESLQPDSRYYVAVYPFIKVTDKFYATEKYVYSNSLVTSAKTYEDLKVAEWDVRRDYIRFSWKDSVKNESGYQVQLLKSNGKVFKTEDIRGRHIKSVGFYVKKLKNKGFSFKIRSYNVFNGEKFYGEWSEPVYCVPQAIATAKKASDTSATLTWQKVKGAKSYSIYQATADGGDYAKLGTVTGTTYTLSNLKDGQDYFYYVSANKVKVGKKKKASTELDVPNDVHIAVYSTKREAEGQ